MFRSAFSVVRRLRPLASSTYNTARIICNGSRSLTNCGNIQTFPKLGLPQSSLLNNHQILDISQRISPIQVRTVIKFSIKKGKRKTVKTVLKRFMRLHWGGWIRTKAGRNKKLWKKSQANKRRLRQHVLCNSTQSTLLDKMVTKFWKKPKYYVDDPYTPYHTREEFSITRKTPRN